MELSVTQNHINLISLFIIYAVVFYHLFTEISTQTIRDIPNIILMIVGVCRIVFLDNVEGYSNVIGFMIGVIVPYIVFNMGNNFGGGTYKLLIASGLILGSVQMIVLLIISPFIYYVYRKLAEKFKFKKVLPSGISVLIMLPFQLLLLF